MNWDEVRAGIMPRKTYDHHHHAALNPSGQGSPPANPSSWQAVDAQHRYHYFVRRSVRTRRFDGEPHHGMAMHLQLAEREASLFPSEKPITLPGGAWVTVLKTGGTGWKRFVKRHQF